MPAKFLAENPFPLASKVGANLPLAPLRYLAMALKGLESGDLGSVPSSAVGSPLAFSLNSSISPFAHVIVSISPGG